MSGIYGDETLTLPIAWLSAIATSDVRLAVYAMRGLYGALRFAHLVGMAVFVGMVVLLDLRGLGLFPAGALDAARPRLAAVLNTAFWCTIGTGVLLFLRDPLGVGLHSMFLPKLLLIVAGYCYGKGVRRLPMLRAAGRRQAAAAVSLAVWLAVIGASTWNHVERPQDVTRALRLHNAGKE